MPKIAVSVPSLLAHAAGGRRVHVTGESLEQALEDLRERHPRLAVHLFDETGGFREHVLCYLNETNTRWLESLDHPLSEGDRITVLQAVSGG